MLLYYPLYLLARAAITKYHRLDGLNNKFASSQFRRLEVSYQGVSRLISSEAFFLSLELVLFSLCLHMVFALCVPMS